LNLGESVLPQKLQVLSDNDINSGSSQFDMNLKKEFCPNIMDEPPEMGDSQVLGGVC